MSIPMKLNYLFICGTQCSAATSLTFPDAHQCLSEGKGVSLLWQFQSNFASRMVSMNQVRKPLCLCVKMARASFEGLLGNAHLPSRALWPYWWSPGRPPPASAGTGSPRRWSKHQMSIICILFYYVTNFQRMNPYVFEQYQKRGFLLSKNLC